LPAALRAPTTGREIGFPAGRGALAVGTRPARARGRPNGTTPFTHTERGAMSAFIVPTEHLHVLIWAGLTRPPYFGGFSWYYGNPTRVGSLSPDTADEVGQMLCDANAASVTHRYRQTGLIRTEYRYRTPRHTAWSVAELLKALGCFEYQACEVPDWPASEAHAFCRALQDLLIHRLPGYSEGPWAISATDVPAVGR
jgi:hypothetical protein